MSESQMPIPPGAQAPAALELEVAHEAPPVAPPMPPVAPKPLPPKKAKVRALRAGFIYNERKVEGNEFEVASDLTGSWFEFVDPVLQRKNLERQVAKKQAANRRGIEDHKRDIASAE